MTRKQKLNAVRRAIQHLKAADGYNPTGVHYRYVREVLESLEKEYKDAGTKVPALGPIRAGGKSVLLHDCTHVTSGLGWPAFDDDVDFDGNADNLAVLAPESGYVDDATSGAQGGDAFYFRGDSGIRYWVGHITTVPRQGTRFSKGAVMTRVSPDHKVPHVHLALDARKLLKGKHLVSHTNYTHGAPKIGVQLKAALDGG